MGTTFKFFEDLASMTMTNRHKETELFLKKLQELENKKVYYIYSTIQGINKCQNTQLI